MLRSRILTISALCSALILGGCASEPPAPVVEKKSSHQNKHQNQRIQHLVFFAFDSAVLPEDSDSILNDHANYLIANPQEVVRIVGYADDIGSYNFNFILGLERAEAVKKSLLQLGVAERQIRTSSLGETTPLNHEQNHESKARNRRVALYY